MREIRQSGSEGGAAMSRSYPYRNLRVLQEAQSFAVPTGTAEREHAIKDLLPSLGE